MATLLRGPAAIAQFANNGILAALRIDIALFSAVSLCGTIRKN
jgi:hypothetical protein